MLSCEPADSMTRAARSQSGSDIRVRACTMRRRQMRGVTALRSSRSEPLGQASSPPMIGSSRKTGLAMSGRMLTNLQIGCLSPRGTIALMVGSDLPRLLRRLRQSPPSRSRRDGRIPRDSSSWWASGPRQGYRMRRFGRRVDVRGTATTFPDLPSPKRHVLELSRTDLGIRPSSRARGVHDQPRWGAGSCLMRVAHIRAMVGMD
jgi:hypothetical protein